MKRVVSLFMLLLLISSTTLMADGRDHAITADRLPVSSRDFLKAHFDDLQISYVEVDKDLMWVKGYEVILIDGTEVNFTRNGEWKEVERRHNAVPVAIVPLEIKQYVQTNFPGKEIMAIEKETRKWEVKLNNGMELSFNMKGQLIDLDAD